MEAKNMSIRNKIGDAKASTQYFPSAYSMKKTPEVIEECTKGNIRMKATFGEGFEGAINLLEFLDWATIKGYSWSDIVALDPVKKKKHDEDED